jgi:hypothetical protein
METLQKRYVRHRQCDRLVPDRVALLQVGTLFVENDGFWDFLLKE